jgi:hypothetical protein
MYFDGQDWIHTHTGTNSIMSDVFAFQGYIHPVIKDEGRSAFATDHSGNVHHYSNGVWHSIGHIEGALNSVWASDPNNVFVAGYGGRLARYRNGEWHLIPTPSHHTFLSIHGTSVNNIFGVGFGGMTFRFDGEDWNYIGRTTNSWRLFSVWAATNGDAWVVGYDGVVIRIERL